jgi:hypothetical protein
MEKWFECLELLHWLRGWNAAQEPGKRVPARFLDALALVLGEPPQPPPNSALVEQLKQLEDRVTQLEAKDRPLR